jgi:uncharacterized protein (TIGR03000 family)
MKKFVTLAAFGVVALVMALPTPARACGWGWGWGCDDDDYCASGWGMCSGYYGCGWGAGYDYYPVGGTSYSYTAYYPQDTAADVNAVTIRMNVPSDARVLIDDKATTQTGADRLFVSPSLAPGYEYVYHVRVQWSENNKAVESKRDVTVHAGDQIYLNFGSPTYYYPTSPTYSSGYYWNGPSYSSGNYRNGRGYFSGYYRVGNVIINGRRWGDIGYRYSHADLIRW